MKDIKVIPDDVENDNHILSNKSHIVLLADNSSIINKNFEVKEHYELQNITGMYFITFDNQYFYY